jgi:hypothetical protein
MAHSVAPEWSGGTTPAGMDWLDLCRKTLVPFVVCRSIQCDYDGGHVLGPLSLYKVEPIPKYKICIKDAIGPNITAIVYFYAAQHCSVFGSCY